MKRTGLILIFPLLLLALPISASAGTHLHNGHYYTCCQVSAAIPLYQKRAAAYYAYPNMIQEIARHDKFQMVVEFGTWSGNSNVYTPRLLRVAHQIRDINPKISITFRPRGRLAPIGGVWAKIYIPGHWHGKHWHNGQWYKLSPGKHLSDPEVTIYNTFLRNYYHAK